MKSVVAAVAVVLVGPMRTQQKMSENDDVASYFFYMKHVKTRSFWVSLRRENKPEKYVGIWYSTLSEALVIFDEFVIESILCV